jgi:ribonucleoside-diphosphate reductase alpha chain
MSDAAIAVLKSTYLQEGEDWEGLCKRVCSVVASVESTQELKKEMEEKFFYYLYNRLFLPNTPALVNLGANHKGCAAACFSLQPEDSIKSILEIRNLAVMILKYGGGVGFELSKIRPEGTLVQSTHKSAMGPVAIARDYNAAGILVTQSGVRKAALMACLRIDHPDIIKFITCKDRDGDLANFNMSVSVTDSFMNKLIKTPEVPHTAHFFGKQWNILPNGEPILRPDRGSSEVLSVKDVWDIICEQVSKNGEPGIRFLDHINRNNPLISSVRDVDNPFYLAGCNPCSEINLEHMGACILVSVDLAKFVEDGILAQSKLQDAFSVATRFADNMIEATMYPDPRIEEVSKKTRRIGIGVMGFTSLLNKLKIVFGSDECLELIDILGRIRRTATSDTSKSLAEERGLYPAAPEGEVYRNVARTTGDPTGTRAIIANTSWAIEPHLYWLFEENRENIGGNRYLPIVHEYISDEALREIEEAAGSDLVHLNNLVQASLPSYITKSFDLDPLKHVDVVAAWQKYTDNSISKTIILPQDESSPELISDIYKYAWESKIKGLTVYPEGSRKGEPMSLRKKKIQRIKRPEVLKSETIAIQFQLNGNTPLKAYATVGFSPENDEIFEVMIKHPQAIDTVGTQFIDLTTRLLSLVLRHRHCRDCKEEVIPLGEVIEQLRKTDGSAIYSVPNILAKALGKYMPKDEPVGTCPDKNCSGNLVMIEGCFRCLTCGYSFCS